MSRFHYQSQLDWEQELVLPQARIIYVPAFLSTAEADKYFQHLHDNLNWRQDHIKMFGREVNIPRLQAWHGDAGCKYHYSGLPLAPQPWTTSLQYLRQRCEQQAGQMFNSVLCNLYRDNNDSMGMHADNEAELGVEPVIASLSLGHPRALRFRHNITGQNERIVLAHGSLLIMAGETQGYWKHGLSKSARTMGPRINLTFRRIM